MALSGRGRGRLVWSGEWPGGLVVWSCGLIWGVVGWSCRGVWPGGLVGGVWSGGLVEYVAMWSGRGEKRGRGCGALSLMTSVLPCPLIISRTSSPCYWCGRLACSLVWLLPLSLVWSCYAIF